MGAGLAGDDVGAAAFRGTGFVAADFCGADRGAVLPVAARTSDFTVSLMDFFTLAAVLLATLLLAIKVLSPAAEVRRFGHPYLMAQDSFGFNPSPGLAGDRIITPTVAGSS